MWIYASDWLLSKVTLCLLLYIKDFAQKKKKKERECCVDLFIFIFIFIFRERREGGEYDQIEEKKKKEIS